MIEDESEEANMVKTIEASAPDFSFGISYSLLPGAGLVLEQRRIMNKE